MRHEIKVPPLGESVSEVTVGSFLKNTGDKVNENEEIVELETEKLNQVLYASQGGVIMWAVERGAVLPIGATLGYIEEGGGETQPAPAKKEAPQKVQEQKKEGTETRKKMTKVRTMIAARLVESLRESAMLTTFNEVDMSAIVKLRTEQKEHFFQKYGVKLGLMPFFIKAVTVALKEFPLFNSYISGDEVVQREYYDIGIAVGGAKGGLAVPVLRGCDRLDLAAIEKNVRDFAARAAEGRLTVDEIQGGSFTITNGGVYGSLLSTPLLNPPQVGILGMHNIQKRVVVVNDQMVIREMMYLALSYDHRLIDGKEAILFLVKIKELLESPEQLMA